VKTLFYPFLMILVKSGAINFTESIINNLIGLFGIRKDVHYFLKYRDYGKLFAGHFTKGAGHEEEILFPMMFGSHSNFNLLNLLFSRYFRDREGLNPVFFICDSAFDICTKDGMIKSREKYPFFCHECWNGYKFIEEKTGIDIIRMSHSLSGYQAIADTEGKLLAGFRDLSECLGYEFEGVPIGKFAQKSVLRYFLTGSLAESNETLGIFKRFIMAGIRYSLAFNKVLDDRPGVKYVILNNGSLVFEAVARALCDKRGLTYITYETYIGNNSLIYKKNGPVMDLNWSEEYNSFVKNFTPDASIKLNVDGFFNDLQEGVGMYAVLNTEHRNDKLTGVDRYACLFTNLNYDTAVIDKNFLFRNMEEWIISVIDFWKTNNPDLTLVIRVHPGELKLVTASREFLGDRIRKACGNNDKILVLDADEHVNSYELIKGMEYGLIYSSTIGLEIARAGKACLVAGLPWYRDKSFVIYPDSADEYFKILKSLSAGTLKFIPDEDELIRAIYFVYFNRVKRLKGIKLYTPREEPNTTIDNPAEMISENITFFNEFRDELFGAGTPRQ
jgi:hypothetical protein